MSDTQEVTALRKAGKLGDARALGERLLQERPTDIWVARALGWVYWAMLEQPVATIEEATKANQQAPAPALSEIEARLRDYARLWKQVPEDAHRDIPGLLHSAMVQRVSKVGKHLNAYLGFMKWSGLDWFQDKDCDPYEKDGKVFPSNLAKAARQCAAWLKARPEKSELFDSFVEAHLRKALDRGRDPEKVWLLWHLAMLLRKRGEVLQAAQTIAPILKQKRSEFWVWAEAARIYQEDQPDLGLACYCQAFCCGADSKFLGKVHIALAQLLARQGELGWASKEIVSASKIYDQQGWGHPRELQDCLAESWYDPSVTGIDTQALYREHAEEALSLCFDSVVVMDATFVGMEDHPYGKKPRPKFVGWLDGESVLIRARRASRSIAKSKPGTPVRLTIGIDEGKREVIEVHPRVEGLAWDQLENGRGVVTRIDAKEGTFQVYLGYQQSYRVHADFSSAEQEPLLEGTSIALWSIPNKKNGKAMVMHWELAPWSDHPDVRSDFGILEIKRSGAAFVENIFVPPFLLDGAVEGQLVEVMAIRDWDTKREREGWKAITLRPAMQEGSELCLTDHVPEGFE